jgi:hypothetical protein
MQRAIIIIFFLLIANYSIGTSIVVIVTKNSVLLAADSKVKINTGKVDSSMSTVCKIYKCNNFYFAIDGYVYQEPWYKLDTVVWNAVSSANSFDDAMYKLKVSWKKVLDDLYMKLATGYKEYLLRNYNLINHASVYLIGKKNNIPHFEGLKAICEGTTPFDIKTKFMELSVSSSEISADSVLVCESSIGVLEGTEFNKLNAIKRPKKEAIRIIEERIKTNPHFVGKPIDAIWITDKKTHWFGENGRLPIEF